MKTKCDDCGTPRHGWDYMVHTPLWSSVATPDTILCLPCLTKRLGRPLTDDDLTTAPVNKTAQYFFEAGIRRAIRELESLRLTNSSAHAMSPETAFSLAKNATLLFLSQLLPDGTAYAVGTHAGFTNGPFRTLASAKAVIPDSSDAYIYAGHKRIYRWKHNQWVPL